MSMIDGQYHAGLYGETLLGKEYMDIFPLKESIKAQLLESDLDLNNTTAKHIYIRNYWYGVLFSDGEKEYFVPVVVDLSTYARTVFPMIQYKLVPVVPMGEFMVIDIQYAIDSKIPEGW